MKCPVLSKCCFCVPLRKGVLSLGYINLIISLLCLPILIVLAVEGMSTEEFKKVYEVEPKIQANAWITIAFTVLDIIMTTILLFGVHKKKKNLLKVYFYTGLVLQNLPLFIDIIFFQIYTVLESFTYFFFTGLDLYLLFLVYNLMYTIEVTEEPSPAMQYTNHSQNTNLYIQK